MNETNAAKDTFRDVACGAVVLFFGLINAGKIWPIVFRPDGTRHDPIAAFFGKLAQCTKS